MKIADIQTRTAHVTKMDLLTFPAVQAWELIWWNPQHDGKKAIE